MAKRLPSLELIASRVETQLDFQLRHFDGLDNKAGIVLGFAGILVAIGNGATVALAVAGRVVAVAAAMLALWAFLPRKYPVLDMRKLRNRYLRADLEFTKLHLLDTEIRMEERASSLLGLKAFRLKLAVGFLAVAVFLTAAGILFEGGTR
ncbi:MAG: hypothetical protein ACRDKF_12305 [Actinomycetota bacterium]